MNKQLLLEKYIKKAVKKALQEEEQNQQKAEKAMYIIHRFPGLKKVVVDLMSPAFGRYISDVSIVAPKPTTFKFNLINGEEFNVIYMGKEKFSAKICGKKYYLQNLGETQRASQGIADILALNYSPTENKEGQDLAKNAELKADLGAGGGGGPATFPGEAPPAPEVPGEPGAAELGPDLAGEPGTSPEESEEETPPTP